MSAGHRRDPAERPPADPEADPDARLLPRPRPHAQPRSPQQRAEAPGHPLRPLLAAVACGGALGAVARHLATPVFPAGPYGFPWGVFAVNVTGCALIGVVTVLVGELPPGGGRVRAAVRHPLVRPFLCVGVLGGFTTFSAYALGLARLLEEGRAGVALAYLAGMPAAALGAVALAAPATRALVRRLPGDPRPAAGDRL